MSFHSLLSHLLHSRLLRSPLSRLLHSRFPVSEIDEDSVDTEEDDSLRVLLLHGKRQSVEMNASGSIEPCAEAVATLLSLTDVAGGGMQVEDDIGDLDDTQVAGLAQKDTKKTMVQKICSCTVRRLSGKPPPK